MTTVTQASKSPASTTYHIDFPPAELADNEQFISTLTQLINEVYTVAEEGIFDPEYRRTNLGEVQGLIQAGFLAVASKALTSPYWQPHDIVGAVRINKYSPTMGNFGPMIAAPQCQGTGLGRQLVQFGEDYCRSWGATTMQIELLLNADNPSKLKIWVKAWYERLGYVVVRLRDFAEHYPHIAPRVITKTDYLVFEKTL